MAIYTGEAEPVDGDWRGRPLNGCARLLGAAHGGQILVSHVTARLCEMELGADIHLVALGAFRFRGLDHAEDVFQVVAPGLMSEFGALTGAEPLHASTERGIDAAAVFDLPSSLAGHVSPVWVGRDDELATLLSNWRVASAGECRTVLIGGEPGSGKTALAARLASELAQNGARVIHGHCVEDMLLPYAAIAEALEQLVASCSGSVLAEHTTNHAGDLCSIVPLLARRVPGLRASTSTTPEADRARLAAAVTGLLQAASRHQPILLVIDDLHWADSGTVALLRNVVHRAPSVPLMIVATYRTTDVERKAPSAQLLADLRRQAGVTRMALAGLSQAAVADLLIAMTEAPPGDDLDSTAVTLQRDTGGNPFFVIEVVRHLTEIGALRSEDGHWTLDLSRVGIPEGIREVVGRRLDRLGGDVCDTLRTAAVIGPHFDLEVLAGVTAATQEHVLDVLESAAGSDVVVEVVGEIDRWRFTHELVRRTLIEQTSASRNTRLHRTVGETLERVRPRDLAGLAHHFAAAAVLGEADRAVRYAVAAADQAAGNAAHGEAARLLERALDQPRPPRASTTRAA